MPHRIVVDVIQRRPVMPIRTHCALDGAEKDFSPVCLFFAISSERRAAVQQTQFMQHALYVRCLHESVIMIRQYAPRKRLSGVGRKDG